ncbi:MAG: glutathione S-transferase [Gammaproteobacteria bacterium]|jgi:glutathione S-transferase
MIFHKDKPMIKVYGDLISGNCYKVKLILELTGQAHEWIHTDVVNGDTRTPEFLKKNVNGRIPLVEFEDGSFMPESNALLFYFAQGSRYWPQNIRKQAETLQWMFFEQYSHEPFIATSRFWIKFLNGKEQFSKQLADAQPKGYAALEVMESALAETDWFVGSQATIADIALFAYTHRAHEGGFSLEGYAAIRQWIKRVESLPGFVAMPD